MICHTHLRVIIPDAFIYIISVSYYLYILRPVYFFRIFVKREHLPLFLLPRLSSSFSFSSTAISSSSARSPCVLFSRAHTHACLNDAHAIRTRLLITIVISARGTNAPRGGEIFGRGDDASTIPLVIFGALAWARH